MTEQMNDLITKLKNARSELERVKEEQKAALGAFQQTAEWQDKQLERLSHSGDVDGLEAAIRDLAISEYQASGNKKPHELVQIKIFRIVDILNRAAAREWCFLNFRPALSLDDKKFEQAAKDGSVPAELATVAEEPRAQIAKDL
jgi:hypothetical protein